MSLVLSITLAASTAQAQIHGSGRPVSRASKGWWISGGVNGATIGDVNDGRNNRKLKFGGDPLWMARGTIERASDEFTSLGIAVAYGKADVVVTPFTVISSPLDTAAPPPTGTALCYVAQGCAAQTDIWSVMGQFRSGGGEKFHTLFEVTVGATGFTKLRSKETSDPLTMKGSAWNATGTLGGGFALPIGRKFQLGLVQDFGIGFSSKKDLPSGTGHTWRVRSTRAYLRMALGSN